MKKGEKLLLLAAALGGSGFVSVKVLLDWGYSAYQVIFGRFLVAVIALSIIYGKEYPKITKEEWKAGAVSGMFLLAMFVLLTVGLSYTTPSVNAFLCNIPAVIVPFLCWGFFHQRPRKRELLAGGVTVIGVALLSVTDGLQFDLGAVLSFLSAVAFAFQLAFLGRLLLGKNPLHIALTEHVAVLVLSAVVLCFTGWDMPPLQLPVIGSVLHIGLLCTAAYFVLQSIAQKETSASTASVLITTESIFAALFSLLLYGEKMSLRAVLGCVVIFMGVLLAQGGQNVEKIEENEG